MQHAMGSMEEEDARAAEERARLPAKLEAESVSNWVLTPNLSANRTDPTALPRCAWLGTSENDDDRLYVRWHRAGESIIRELPITHLAKWEEELRGFEPFEAFRIGMDYQRMLDQRWMTSAA